MVGILLEVGFGHLTTHDGQFLVVVHILARFTVLIDKETVFQFRPCLKNGLERGLHAV